MYSDDCVDGKNYVNATLLSFLSYILCNWGLFFWGFFSLVDAAQVPTASTPSYPPKMIPVEIVRGRNELPKVVGNVGMKACPCKQCPNIYPLETLLNDQSLLAILAAGVDLQVVPI